MVPVRPVSTETEGWCEEWCGECEDVGNLEEEEEQSGMRRRKAAGRPTAEEVRLHKATHLPFRDWCKECVAGRAKDWPHHPRESAESLDVPAVHFDYCFPRNEVGGEYQVVLVGKDQESKMFAAHVVPGKGADFEWIAQQVAKDIKRCGIHGSVVLRSDQEPALTNLLDEVCRTRGDAKTLPEASPTGDSRANGLAERAVQSVEEMIRVHKLALESKTGVRLEVRHALFAWLVEHCADCLNKRVVGADGRTAWERVHGRRYHGEMLEFASKVMFRVVGKVQGSIMTERWYEGVWLGKSATSDEHLVMKNDGLVVRSRSVRELDAKITMEDFDKLKSEPHDPTGTMKAVSTIPRASIETKDMEQEEFGIVPRRVRLSKEVVERFGPTPNCVKCRAVARNDPAYATTPHSKECRKRLEAEMIKDPAFRQKLEQAEERCEAFMSNYVKKKTSQAAAASGRGGEDSSASGPPQQQQQQQPQPQQQQQQQSPQEASSSSTAPAAGQEAQGGAAQGQAARGRAAQGQAAQGEAAQGGARASNDDDMGVPVAREDNMTDADKRRTEDADDTMTDDAAEQTRNVKPKLQALHQRYAYDVVEIFSPPRVCERARKKGLEGGYSLDILSDDPITGRRWDLTKDSDLGAFRKMRKESRARLLIASPPCRLFSSLQNLRKTAIPQDEWAEAVRMLRVGIEACRNQHKDGDFFMFEHPRGSKALNDPMVQELMAMEGVYTITLDQCQYGLVSTDALGTAPALKPTVIITNMRSAVEILGRRCRGGHRHVHLVSGRAGPCAHYPPALVDAMLKCLEMEKRALNNGGGLCSLDELHPEEPMCENCEEYAGFYDDLTWEPLDGKAVKIGRGKEMVKLTEREVYEWFPRAEAMATGSKIIKTKWVQNKKGKGDQGEDIVKCRFVGMEFANEKRDDLFAGTPPLWVARLLISRAMSKGDKDRGLMAVDVASAFLYADVLREIFIELPQEDTEGRKRNMVGRLRKALYGTRDAPLAWQEALTQSLLAWGFRRSELHPALFYHPVRDIELAIHVDDMLCSGNVEDLEWFARTCAEKYEVKNKIIQRVGEELTYLGRTIRRVAGGIEWEADGRHLEVLKAEWGMTECSTVNTPIVIPKATGENQELMNPEAARQYRRAVARINYLAADRPDLAVAATHLARTMAKPYVGDEQGVKRVIRYLAGRPRCAWRYGFQEEPHTLDVYTDSDWAGCTATRKSTSGGIILHGRHPIMHWSKLQGNVALSSGEAELNSQVKGVAEALGVRNAARDLGVELQIRSHCDSSAARGILNRVGVGKMKHLEVKHLWVQEHVRTGEVHVHRVPRAENPSDAMTHPSTRPDLDRHLSRMGVWMRPGRAV